MWSNPSSECRMVLKSVPALWQSKNEFEFLFNEIGSKPIPLDILTTSHPKNHTDCHLHHQHALLNTRRLTFNRNVVKLLEFVQEWQNPYSVTINVVVPLHKLTYSRIWLLIQGWMYVCSCVSRMVSVSKPSTDTIG